MAILTRFRTAWNAFVNVDSPVDYSYSGGSTYSASPPSRPRRRSSNERTIISSILTRMAIDVADVAFKHVQFDKNDMYESDIDSHLNDCLTLEPNQDQGPRAFRQDIAMTMFDKGVSVVVPIDTTRDPKTEEVFDIFSMRVGEVTQWLPHSVRVSVWNDTVGKRQEITVPKRSVAIAENPMYMVMNEPNSTLQRLIRKLNLLDIVDDQSSSGKLDLIIQLPYVVKSQARKDQAEKRREEIEFQLKGSQYGIAYTEATEKITQLNRPAENNLLAQVEYLTKMLHDQLGITPEVLAGTADEKTMNNYKARTIEPIVDAIREAMQRSFIGPIGTKKNERIHYFTNPFKLTPVGELADVVDKLSRNEIVSPNEIRGFIGMKPSSDPKANELRNSNMPPTEPVPGDEELEPSA